MTLVLGLRCSDGFVMSADTAVTFAPGLIRGAQYTTQELTQKIEVLSEKIVFGISGSLGIGQRIRDRIGLFWKHRTDYKNKPDFKLALRKEIWKELEPELAVASFLNVGLASAIIVIPCFSELLLMEMMESGQLEEVEAVPFTSIGSGKSMADPLYSFLKSIFWPTGKLTVREGVLLSTWIMDFVIEHNSTGVGGPITTYTITGSATNPTIKLLDNSELDDYRQDYSEAIKAMREYRSTPPQGTPAVSPPPPIPQ